MANLTASVKVRLDADDKAELEERAASTERAPSAIGRRAIRYYLALWRETGEEPALVS